MRKTPARYFLKLGEDIFMSQQAFSLARQNIKWEALLELFELTVDEAYRQEIKRWKGYRLFAIDGSKIALPNDLAMREYFGAMGAGNTSPTAQGSIRYDVCNDLIAVRISNRCRVMNGVLRYGMWRNWERWRVSARN
jgi:hypothetical protein